MNNNINDLPYLNVKLIARCIILFYGLLKFILGCFLLCISIIGLICIFKGKTDHVILGSIIIFIIFSITVQLFWFSVKGISLKKNDKLEEKLNFYFYLFTPYIERKIFRTVVFIFNTIYYPCIDCFCSTKRVPYFNYEKIMGRAVKKKCEGIYNDFYFFKESDIPLFLEDEQFPFGENCFPMYGGRAVEIIRKVKEVDDGYEIDYIEVKEIDNGESYDVEVKIKWPNNKTSIELLSTLYVYPTFIPTMFSLIGCVLSAIYMFIIMAGLVFMISLVFCHMGK